MSLTEAIPVEFLRQLADLTRHRIEGIARMGNTPFDCPIVSQIDGNLWSGGCPEWGVPAYFRFVLNLYPWVHYPVPETTTLRQVELYDSADGVDTGLVYDLADWVNVARAKGPTLVHCQAGLNRSALVTGLALMRSGMTADAAIALLREKRSPAVLCNPTFEAWLRAQPPAPLISSEAPE